MGLLDTLGNFVQANLRSIVDAGSESYETRLTRTILKAGAVLLFVAFIVFLLWRKK